MSLVKIAASAFTASKVLARIAKKSLRIGWRTTKKAFFASGADKKVAPIVKPVEAHLGELMAYSSLFTKLILRKVDPSKGFEQISEMEKEKTPTEVLLGAAIMVLLTGGTIIYTPVCYAIKFFVGPKVQPVY